MTAAFSAGAVLTAANLNSAVNTMTVNAQTGAGYTLVLGDGGKAVSLSNATAQTLTIPTNASVAFATGTVIEVLNIGAGTWTVSGAGVTISGTTSVPTNGRVRLLKTGTDTWWSAAMDAAVAGSGLALITSTTATATGAVSVNNCFTSTYDNYRIIIENLTADANRTLNLRWRASASDNSTANYNYQYGYESSTTAGGSRSTAQTNGIVGYASTTAGSFYIVDVFLPQAAAVTSALSLGGYVYAGPTLDTIRYFNNFSATTQFDGFSLIASAGSITTPTNGIRVYGYKN